MIKLCKLQVRRTHNTLASYRIACMLACAFVREGFASCHFQVINDQSQSFHNDFRTAPHPSSRLIFIDERLRTMRNDDLVSMISQ